MILRTVLRDCLQLNWAFRRDRLPAPPPPLTYEVHSWSGAEWVFASALLFRHEGLALGRVPGLRLSYPQFNLRFYVLDGEGTPAILLRTVLVPSWVVPAATLVARQRVGPASFEYPRPSAKLDAESWTWRVHRRCGLTVSARASSAAPGEGPRLGDFSRTVSHFRLRSRGYSWSRGGLRAIEASHHEVEAIPVRAEVAESDLLTACMQWQSGDWPGLHSAWLVPEAPFVFELGGQEVGRVPRSAPAPGC